MSEFDQSIVRTQESILATNKVLKNTYMLLSATLIFSAFTAFIASQVVSLESMRMVSISSTIGAFLILFFVLPKYAESSGMGGIVVTFLFTGLLGFGVGPLVSAVMTFHGNGTQIVATALGGTGVIFLSLSAYVLTTKKDFSFLAGFLFAGVIILIIASVLSMVMGISGLPLAINVAVLFIFSGFILFDTSRIIHGGEDNYIHACVGLYISIFNIFNALLSLLLSFSKD
ncbi:Putative TEGT family carrier/transport protein [hydrothermal vent metagenome]|uniref:TEGT family carrier/transport protein n=1 Tax=hydrothermal vent metagenome TaxID=652676 RepID=A0A3B0Z3T7_9ZZZZ